MQTYKEPNQVYQLFCPFFREVRSEAKVGYKTGQIFILQQGRVASGALLKYDDDDKVVFKMR